MSEFYYFRSNGGGYSIFFVLLVSYVMGKWMARALPIDEFRIGNWRFTLNPGNVSMMSVQFNSYKFIYINFIFILGPFNIKEHVLIAVSAGAGGGSAYGTVSKHSIE